MERRGIEATQFKYEFRSDLKVIWRSIMTSKAAKMAVRGYKHIDQRVIEVVYFKSKVKFDL